MASSQYLIKFSKTNNSSSNSPPFLVDKEMNLWSLLLGTKLTLVLTTIRLKAEHQSL